LWKVALTQADLGVHAITVQNGPPHSAPDQAAPAVLAFWFNEVGSDRWYAKDAALDERIRTRFAALRDEVLATRARAWRDTPDHLLAAIIMADQFSRNLYRGSAKAFEADPLALELTNLALAKGWIDRVPPERRQFLLMPLMHSEALSDQQRSLDEFRRHAPANLDFALKHYAQIAKFARFPGRNAALGRRTPPAEQEALDAGAAF
jgi:uncharacterized protein (DUF924 family)